MGTSEVREDFPLGPCRFEDFRVGQEIRTRKHTITEKQILDYAAISGDHNPLHTDEDFASKGPYGVRIAPGLLVLAIASGLATELGVVNESVLAFRQLSCKFRGPVFIGDAISVQFKVARVKSIPRTGGGLVDVELRVYNQAEQAIQTGTWTMWVQGAGP
jgi:acyl dehydratase